MGYVHHSGSLDLDLLVSAGNLETYKMQRAKASNVTPATWRNTLFTPSALGVVCDLLQFRKTVWCMVHESCVVRKEILDTKKNCWDLTAFLVVPLGQCVSELTEQPQCVQTTMQLFMRSVWPNPGMTSHSGMQNWTHFKWIDSTNVFHLACTLGASWNTCGVTSLFLHP